MMEFNFSKILIMSNRPAYIEVLLISMVLMTGFTACQQRSVDIQHLGETGSDEDIYMTVLQYCANATSETAISEGRIVFEAGPVKKLLLLDSTRLVPKEIVQSLNAFVDDTTLVKDFAKQSQVKTGINEGWSRQIQLRKFPRQTFTRFLQLNQGNGFMELYKKFPGISGIVEFSSIGYNASKDQALVEICYYKSPQESFAIIYLLNKKDAKWIIADKQ